MLSVKEKGDNDWFYIHIKDWVDTNNDRIGIIGSVRCYNGNHDPKYLDKT